MYPIDPDTDKRSMHRVQAYTNPSLHPG